MRNPQGGAADVVYLDHAASTPMRPEAIAAMLPYLADHPANPSGGHGGVAGREDGARGRA